MSHIDRRGMITGAAGLAALTACAGLPASRRVADPGFVTRSGTALLRGGRRYRIVGANCWYAAWLGSPGSGGDRARLARELDRLQALGINNVRIMASGEEGPLKNSVTPAFTRPNGAPNEDLYLGLDHALVAIGRRGMTAVLVLGNFWEWSGGFSALLDRAGAGYIDNGEPAHPWPAFADSSARLYTNPAARQSYADSVARLLARTNAISGARYVDDPTILSWQLANEPRPGGSDAAIAANRAAYLAWIAETAVQIRAAAPRHLVSLGHEGLQGCNGQADLVVAAHEHVDYLTAHIWPLNWGWAKGDDLAGSWPETARLTARYIADHRRIATEIGKPLVIEEFGFPRDGETYAPTSTTRWRERFYRTIYHAVEADWAGEGPIVGSAFWAWTGEARSSHPDARFRRGDTQFMGDPPHEPQGWYGNFDSDKAMAAVIRGHADRAGA